MGEERGYPLEAARTVRAMARDEAAERLADALRELERARARHARAAERLVGFRSDEQARMEREREKLGVVCRGAALQREESYRARRRDELARLERTLARARGAQDAAAHAVVLARRDLERASAEAGALERHHERWADAERRAGERRAEDERDELASAGLRSPPAVSGPRSRAEAWRSDPSTALGRPVAIRGRRRSPKSGE